MANRVEVINKDLVAQGSVPAATGTAVDVRGLTAISMYCSLDSGTSYTVKYQGTTDPAGLKGYADLAFRAAGGGAYATAAATINPTPPEGVSHYLAPDDNIAWLRAVTAAPTGSPVGKVVMLAEM